jgi:hypothetical protein
MQLLANENFPLISVHLLRQANYDIASITEDSPGIEDPEVLALIDRFVRSVIRWNSFMLTMRSSL